MIFGTAWRLVAVSAIVGAGGIAQAQDADWSALGESGWGETQGGAAEEAAPQRSQFASDISTAFQDLGMAAARADCFGRVLEQKLKAKHQDDAVELLRSSEDKDDVRRHVSSKGFDSIGGFRSANKSGPKQTGS